MKRHPSMASEDLRGTLQFTMLYDPIAGILNVRLVEVKEINQLKI